jgi:hypothetical protein
LGLVGALGLLVLWVLRALGAWGLLVLKSLLVLRVCWCSEFAGAQVYWHSDSAYYNDNIFLKHRKKRSSGGSTVLSADDGRWMSRGICRLNGRYLI